MFGNNDSNDQPQDTSGSFSPSGPPAVNPATPSDDNPALPAPVAASAPSDTAPSDTVPASSPAPSSTPDDLLDSDSSNNDLIDIKQKALQHLSPLVGHLEQTPEEKFRTMMMMIQASDDQSLIKSAYEAAEQIEDEKERAQALLDIINEINYFTQQKET